MLCRVETCVFFLGCLCGFTFSTDPFRENLFARVKRQVPQVVLGNANKFVDELLQNNSQLLQDKVLEPFYVGDIEACSALAVAGLTTVRRIGNATIHLEDDDILVDLRIGFRLLRGSCNYIEGLLGVRSVIRFILKDLGIHITLRAKVKSATNIDMSVVGFEVLNPGQLDIYFDGQDGIGIFIQPFFRLLRWKIKRLVQWLMPEKLETEVAKNIHRAEELVPIRYLGAKMVSRKEFPFLKKKFSRLFGRTLLTAILG